MPNYMTRQRRALLDYLSAHADETLSAREIAAALAGVSASAVYRNLAALETEGKLRRVKGAREAAYQYVGAASCRGRVHLKCKRCNRTFHMDERGAERLVGVVEQAEGFAVDKGDTVLYGVCELCQDD